MKGYPMGLGLGGLWDWEALWDWGWEAMEGQGSHGTPQVRFFWAWRSSAGLGGHGRPCDAIGWYPLECGRAHGDWEAMGGHGRLYEGTSWYLSSGVQELTGTRKPRGAM